ncbi:MAG: hypothetical protein IK071_06535 [Lachnospiraceae bacterium]|nr:hypothetical protein [Lachnospiraceae bacterium]
MIYNSVMTRNKTIMVILIIVALVLFSACSSSSEPEPAVNSGADNGPGNGGSVGSGSNGKSGTGNVVGSDSNSRSDSNGNTGNNGNAGYDSNGDGGNNGISNNNTGNNTDNNGNTGNNTGNNNTGYASGNGPLSSADLKKARANYKPRFTVDLTGNFTDIDPTLFEKYYLGDQLVGRWYEDGWLNGYYLEIYGNGTWQFFGEETVGGRYEAVNNSFCLTENRFGRFYEAWSWIDPADGRTKLKLDGSVLLKSRADETIEFYREADSKYCDDLEKYYIEKFPYRELAGKWYKVEGASETYFYQFLETGNFQETINAAAMEIGWIEDSGEGKGKYIGHEANSHQTISVEFPGDGYLYIKGIKFKKRSVDSDSAPESVVGKWYYWDYDKNVITDNGIELFSDWTFRSLPDTPSSKHGTFIRLDDDYYPLFDDEGNYVTTLEQDMWEAAEKRAINDMDYGREIDNQGLMYFEIEKRAQDGDYSYENDNTDDDTSVQTKCFTVDGSGFFEIDRSMFGLTYDAFKERVGRNDLMQPEAWPWWGHDLEVVYVNEDNETYACMFQYGRFVCVYRDAADENPGNMFYEAMSTYGTSANESTYWNGTTAYEWKLSDCYYKQYIETYGENDLHYRQQYTSFDYVE